MLRDQVLRELLERRQLNPQCMEAKAEAVVVVQDQEQEEWEVREVLRLVGLVEEELPIRELVGLVELEPEERSQSLLL